MELSISLLIGEMIWLHMVDVDLFLVSFEWPRRIERVERTEVSNEDINSLSQLLLTYIIVI